MRSLASSQRRYPPRVPRVPRVPDEIAIREVVELFRNSSRDSPDPSSRTGKIPSTCRVLRNTLFARGHGGAVEDWFEWTECNADLYIYFATTARSFDRIGLESAFIGARAYFSRLFLSSLALTRNARPTYDDVRASWKASLPTPLRSIFPFSRALTSLSPM